jgi:hypothetical protein
MGISEYKSKAPDIVGSTTINHSARVKMGLNCSEYVLLDHISRKNENGSVVDTLTVYIATGFGFEETKRLITSLMGKGFLIPKNGDDFDVTNRWHDAFANIDKEFEFKFWTKDGKVQWTGTKKKALEYYVKVRKKYSVDFLVKQRDDYFKFLELQVKYRNFDQQRVMCQVFLNPANERFLEDYASYVQQLETKYAPPKTDVKPVTKADIMSQYGKNNNEQGGS